MTNINAAERVRAAAVAEVSALQIDRTVRLASQLGRFDGTANWEHVHDMGDGRRVRIRSTHGAGTNSASVMLLTTGPDKDTQAEVYYCDGHGSYLRRYRSGWWVAVIRELADQRVRANAADTLIAEDKKLAQEVADFTPLPD
jgi:hypothetical protein